MKIQNIFPLIFLFSLVFSHGDDEEEEQKVEIPESQLIQELLQEKYTKKSCIIQGGFINHDNYEEEITLKNCASYFLSDPLCGKYFMYNPDLASTDFGCRCCVPGDRLEDDRNWDIFQKDDVCIRSGCEIHKEKSYWEKLVDMISNNIKTIAGILTPVLIAISQFKDAILGLFTSGEKPEKDEKESKKKSKKKSKIKESKEDSDENDKDK